VAVTVIKMEDNGEYPRRKVHKRTSGVVVCFENYSDWERNYALNVYRSSEDWADVTCLRCLRRRRGKGRDRQ